MSNLIEVYRGDTFYKPVNVTLKSTGAIYDLTGYTAKMTVKKTASKPDSTALISITGVITSPESGVITFTALPSITETWAPGNYVYDVQIVNESTSSVLTVVKDRFIVLEDVTLTGIPVVP